MTPATQGLVIGGDERSGARGWMEVVDPATTRPIGRVANAGPVDALAALDGAARAQRSWRRSAPSDRSAILHRAAAAVGARADAIARTITAESGKPLAEARAEIAYAADHLRRAAGAAERIGGRAAPAPRADGWHLTVRDPVAPCLLITPWNFPAAMVARKVAPAIAAGCAMVLKPAEQTPLTALAVAGLLHEAGLPDGVLNVITGDDPATIASAILGDPRLRKVSFTGSTAVGRDVLQQSAHNVLRASMELGGNAPFVVFDDADLDTALAGVVMAKLRSAS